MTTGEAQIVKYLSRLRCSIKLLAASFLLSSVFGSVFAATPSSVQVTYEVYKGDLKIGMIEESYTRDNGHYILSSTTRATGLLAIFKPGRILINSSGLIDSQGLKPLRFSDQREGNENRNRSAEFNWEAKQLVLIHQKQRTVVALPEGAQDRLSAMYQFMFMSLQTATKLDFPMTNGSKLDNYHYVISHKQKLKTPAGEFDTLYLDNQASKGESKTEIWLATDQHNLPCKMTITDADGSQLTQILSKLSILP